MWDCPLYLINQRIAVIIYVINFILPDFCFRAVCNPIKLYAVFRRLRYLGVSYNVRVAEFLAYCDKLCVLAYVFLGSYRRGGFILYYNILSCYRRLVYNQRNILLKPLRNRFLYNGTGY